jgi:hypothetical protein
MRSIFAVILLATSCSVWPAYSFAEDAAAQLVGTWKLVSWLTKFDAGEIVEPYGPNAKGRLVLTPDGSPKVLRHSDEEIRLEH